MRSSRVLSARVSRRRLPAAGAALASGALGCDSPWGVCREPHLDRDIPCANCSSYRIATVERPSRVGKPVRSGGRQPVVGTSNSFAASRVLEERGKASSGGEYRAGDVPRTVRWASGARRRSRRLGGEGAPRGAARTLPPRRMSGCRSPRVSIAATACPAPWPIAKAVRIPWDERGSNETAASPAATQPQPAGWSRWATLASSIGGLLRRRHPLLATRSLM